MPQRISLDPNPPQAGSWCTVCYDFDGLANPVAPPVGIIVKFQPAGLPPAEWYPEQPDDGSKVCTTIWIPETATSGTAIDEGGHSDDLLFFVDS